MPSRTNGLKMPDDRPDIARKIASIMSQQRRGREAPEYGKRGGRVDRRRLASVAVNNDRVFSTRSGVSATRLKVVVLLDLSGSMHGKNAQDAVQTAWDFILACRELNNVDLEVWGHTTGYLQPGEEPLPGVEEDQHAKAKAKVDAWRAENPGMDDWKAPYEVRVAMSTVNSRASGVREGHYVAAFHLYEGRMSRRQFYAQVRDIQMSGNEDGWSIDAVLRDVERRNSRNQRTLLLVVSDGAPAYSEGSHGIGHVRGVVNRWRKRGVGIISVSVARALRKEVQNNMYGHEWVVPFSDDSNLSWWERNARKGMPKATVVALGRAIGRALS